tara:strand:+ start:109 stop:279 length:171 start_codon:yes stop_codon:yes gene_type:complete
MKIDIKKVKKPIGTFYEVWADGSMWQSCPDEGSAKIVSKELDFKFNKKVKKDAKAK